MVVVCESRMSRNLTQRGVARNSRSEEVATVMHTHLYPAYLRGQTYAPQYRHITTQTTHTKDTTGYARVMLFPRASGSYELQKLRQRRTYYRPVSVDGMIYQYTGLTSLLLLINGLLDTVSLLA